MTTIEPVWESPYPTSDDRVDGVTIDVVSPVAVWIDSDSGAPVPAPLDEGPGARTMGDRVKQFNAWHRANR